jgi:hypothetical protein
MVRHSVILKVATTPGLCGGADCKLVHLKGIYHARDPGPDPCSQADADIPLPDEGPGAAEDSQEDSHVVSDVEEGEDEVVQSHAGGSDDDDEGEDLLENAHA